MSWKLRWAGHNRGKVRVYREDGSYFYGDPSKYPPQEPQYTEEEKWNWGSKCPWSQKKERWAREKVKRIREKGKREAWSGM